MTTDNIDKKFIKLIDIIKPFNDKNVTVYEIIKNFNNKNNKIYDEGELDLISEIIDDINKKLSGTKIGIIELDRFSLDEVIEIFNNINTKGEKLSIFEIINAKWYSININLEKEFNKLDEEISHLGFENIDFQIMLDGLYLNINNKKISTIEKIEYKLLENSDYYNKLLSNYLNSFNKMCKYLSRLNFNKKNLPSKIILKWLSYFYMINNHKDPDGEQNKFLKKYIFLLAINNVYRSSTNSQLLKDIEFVNLLKNKKYNEIEKIFDSFEKKYLPLKWLIILIMEKVQWFRIL